MASSLNWTTGSPEDQGLDSGRLESAWQVLAERGSNTFLVARRGELVFERYAGEWAADKRHYTASLAKAIIGGLSLALAIDDGLVDPDDLVARFVPAWRDDGAHLKSKITIRHLATHTSGIEEAELSAEDRAAAAREGVAISDQHMELPGWKGEFWRGTRDPEEGNPFLAARDSTRVIFEPGSAYAYSNPGIAMLSYCITAALRGSPWPDVRSYLEERLFAPLGLGEEGEGHSFGYGRTYQLDGLPLVANWGGASFTARAVARIGQMMLQDGAWQGRQLISPAVVRQVAAPAGMPVPEQERAAGNPAPGAGLGFWVNADGVWPMLPRDAFAGAGAGNQILLVVPSLDLVVVRNGSLLAGGTNGMFWDGVVDFLIGPVMHSLSLRPPYPPSEVITGVTWDPPSQVRRAVLGGKRKDGSDNWPLTWADDGHLYTAYGDGYGFEPQLESKLSLGFAVITGGPEDFTGLNLRSDGERLGPGKQGEKACGLLMVEGVLYVWVRNVDGEGQTSRLGWSSDHGKSWEWADWIFGELGHPGFVNFGRNYAGARDEFVYVLSHDHPSAYEQADHFVLARVPKAGLRDRSAYEFLVRLNEDGDPRWSAAIEERGPMFAHAGQCRRSSMTYNAGLGRYLLWQQLTADDSDTRFEGGFGLYDAPEPWGPWTTAFFTDRWDVGPGDLGHFNQKWMSEDGRTVWMVFSGSDNFCVRRSVYEVASPTARLRPAEALAQKKRLRTW